MPCLRNASRLRCSAAAPAPLHPLVGFGALTGVGRWVMQTCQWLGFAVYGACSAYEKCARWNS